MTTATRIEDSSGNVFADLGFPHADQELTKARLIFEIYRIIKARGLTQARAAQLEEGSTVLVQKIDRESVPKVSARISDVAGGEGPEDALRAFNAIDRRLAADNAVGHLYREDGAEIIHFPGCEKAKPLTFGAFNQPGSLDGLLIRIGGKDETVPVHLQEGSVTHNCNATREMARRLAPHLFAGTLRVHGTGRWERDAEGAWNLKRFTIADFEVLEDAPLSAVVERLRQVPGSGWKEIDDPYTELQRLRQGPDEAH
jgi:predicted XRE-type DNA-binding protein